MSGRSAARLAHQFWELGVGSSNLLAPTIGLNLVMRKFPPTLFSILFVISIATSGFVSGADISNLPPVFSTGSSNQPLIALTFDDGPKPERILPILNILDQYQVKASFFVVGKMAEQNRDIILRMAQSGHEVCNHTYNHPNLTRLDSAQVHQELRQTSDVIETTTGQRPRFFRPPGGRYTPEVIGAATEEGLSTALWNINAEDFTYLTPLRDIGAPPRESFNRHSKIEIHDLVMRKARNGSIVLFHAGGPETQSALPKIIVELKSRGYRLVTLSDLMSVSGNLPIPERGFKPEAIF